MSSKIEYYINYSKRTVTAVINNVPSTIVNRCNDIRPIQYGLYIPYTYLHDASNVISSTIKAEDTDIFDEQDIERLKYLARCSVKKKYHECFVRYESKIIKLLNKYANILEKDVQRNRNIINNKPFKYIEREEWLNMKNSKNKNDTQEI